MAGWFSTRSHERPTSSSLERHREQRPDKRLHGAFQGEIVSDFKDRPEGVRVKHSVGRNSVKIYDKEGSVLRVETTVNDASQIQVVRPRRKDGKLARQELRRSVVDLGRRAEACQRVNVRYLDHFAIVAEDRKLAGLLEGICSAAKFKGRRVRGLKPWSPNSSSCVHDLPWFQPRVPVVETTGGHERRWKSNHDYQSGPHEPLSARTFLDMNLSATVC